MRTNYDQLKSHDIFDAFHVHEIDNDERTGIASIIDAGNVRVSYGVFDNRKLPKDKFNIQFSIDKCVRDSPKTFVISDSVFFEALPAGWLVAFQTVNMQRFAREIKKSDGYVTVVDNSWMAALLTDILKKKINVRVENFHFIPGDKVYILSRKHEHGEDLLKCFYTEFGKVHLHR